MRECNEWGGVKALAGVGAPTMLLVPIAEVTREISLTEDGCNNPPKCRAETHDGDLCIMLLAGFVCRKIWRLIGLSEQYTESESVWCLSGGVRG